MQCNCMAAHLGSLSLYHKTPRRYSNKHGDHCYQYVFVDDVIIVVDKDTDTDTTSTTSTTFTTSTTSTTSSTSTTSTTSTTSNTSNF